MEETGKKVFLPVSSGRNWKKTGTKLKKLEEIHVINSACKRSVGMKFPDTENNIGMSMQICISLNSGILQGSIDLSNDRML